MSETAVPRKWMRRGGGARNAHKITAGRSEGKKSLDKLGREYNSKTDLKETGCGETYSICLAQDRAQSRPLMKTVTDTRIPNEAGNLFTSSATIV